MSDILDSIDDLLDDDANDDNFEDTSLDDELGLNDTDGDLDEILSASDELDEVFESEGLAEIMDEDYDVEKLMSKHEAIEITEAIKSVSGAMLALLVQAHEGKAYRAMGYSTWAEYVRGEFDYSVQRSYQLLDQAKIISMIEEATPEGTSVKLTEAQARDIKRELPKIVERIEEETYELEPEDAEDAVNRIIAEAREDQKAADEAIAAREKSVKEAEEEGIRKGIEQATDALLEADTMSKMTGNADDEFVEVEVSGDGSLSPEQTMNLYNFANILTSVSSLPVPDEFVDSVPDTNFDDLFDQVVEAASYMNRLATLMEVRRDERMG